MVSPLGYCKSQTGPSRGCDSDTVTLFFSLTPKSDANAAAAAPTPAAEDSPRAAPRI